MWKLFKSLKSTKILSLILDFLRGRSQVTKIGRQISRSVLLTSGVVRGSCLGLLRFLIDINDLVTVFNTNVTPKLYADDLKLYACLRVRVRV